MPFLSRNVEIEGFGGIGVELVGEGEGDLLNQCLRGNVCRAANGGERQLLAEGETCRLLFKGFGNHVNLLRWRCHRSASRCRQLVMHLTNLKCKTALGKQNEAEDRNAASLRAVGGSKERKP